MTREAAAPRALEWTVPTDHPAFAGHFPGDPILPGVVLLDRVLDLLADGAVDREAGGGLEIAEGKFLEAVRPGERLRLRCDETATGAWAFEVVRVGPDGRSTVVAAGRVRRAAESGR